MRRNGQTLYFRRYPTKGLAAQTVGYSTSARTQTGLEESLNDYLTGANTNLSNAFHRTLEQIGGATVHGNNVVLTLNPAAQELALQQLAGRLRRRRRDEPAHRARSWRWRLRRRTTRT